MSNRKSFCLPFNCVTVAQTTLVMKIGTEEKENVVVLQNLLIFVVTVDKNNKLFVKDI